MMQPRQDVEELALRRRDGDRGQTGGSCGALRLVQPRIGRYEEAADVVIYVIPRLRRDPPILIRNSARTAHSTWRAPSVSNWSMPCDLPMR